MVTTFENCETEVMLTVSVKSAAEEKVFDLILRKYVRSEIRKRQWKDILHGEG